MICQPSTYARFINYITAIDNNMMHVKNSLLPNHEKIKKLNAINDSLNTNINELITLTLEDIDPQNIEFSQICVLASLKVQKCIMNVTLLSKLQHETERNSDQYDFVLQDLMKKITNINQEIASILLVHC